MSRPVRLWFICLPIILPAAFLWSLSPAQARQIQAFGAPTAARPSATALLHHPAGPACKPCKPPEPTRQERQNPQRPCSASLVLKLYSQHHRQAVVATIAYGYSPHPQFPDRRYGFELRETSAAELCARAPWRQTPQASGWLYYRITAPEHLPVEDSVRIQEILEAGTLLRRHVLSYDPTYTLPTVQLRAQREPLVSAVPGPRQQVSLLQLRQTPPVGLPDALRSVPGLNAVAEDGMGQRWLDLSIRGLNPRRSSRVLLLEDGFPIAPAPYTAPAAYYTPPPERIQRIEVQKGAGSLAYGPQTMGGVVNFITAPPSPVFKLQGQLTAGTNGLLTTYHRLEGFGSQSIRPSLELTTRRGDGHRDNNAFEQLNLTAQTLFKLGQAGDIRLKLNLNQDNLQTTYSGLTPYSFETNPRFNPKEHDTYLGRRLGLGLHWTDKHWLFGDQDFRAWFQVLDRDWWREEDMFVRAGDYQAGRLVETPYTTPGPLVRVGNGQRNIGNIRRFYTGGVDHQSRYTYPLGARILGKTTLGVKASLERFADQQLLGSAPDARSGVLNRFDSSGQLVDQGRWHTYRTWALAGYALQEFVVANRFKLRVGLRYIVLDQNRTEEIAQATRSQRNQVWLPGLGFNWRLGYGELFGSLHRGYITPQSRALRSLLAVPSQGDEAEFLLKPETSWNTELGWRAAWPGLRVEATAYWLEVQDLVAADRGTVFNNLGRVSNRGLELALEVNTDALASGRLARPRGLPGLRLTYTLLHSTIRAGSIPASQTAGAEANLRGNSLPYAPTHNLFLSLFSQIGAKWRLRADFQYVGRQFADYENLTETNNRGDQGPIPAYWLLGASLSWQVHPNASLTLAGTNLLDRVYIGSRLNSNPARPQASFSTGILPGPRRQVNLTFRWRFAPGHSSATENRN